MSKHRGETSWRFYDHDPFIHVLSGHCTVEPFSFFGVNATVRDGARIAEGSFVAMAAAITRDTEAWGVYKGNPAKKAEISSRDLDF